MLVPQSMAYAMIAGLPPETGLYASIVPVLVYSFFGSSRFLAVGPVAMVSLLTATGIADIADGDTGKFIALALALALISGLIQLFMGVIRLGFLVNYLSHPVLVGFTSAAALVIGASQIKHVLGVNVPRTEHPYEIVPELINAAPGFNPTTLTIAVLSIIALLMFGKMLARVARKLKIDDALAIPITKSGALVVVCVSILIVWGFSLDQTSGVLIVGSIPEGLAMPAIPEIDLASVSALLPVALIISLVGFTESISIATTLASKKRQRIDANQELIALGSANVAASFTGGYPVTGGLSRSAVNYNAGANTGLASIVTALLVALTVLFLTPLFYYLPKAVLAAVVIVAVAGLFDGKSFFQVWKYNKPDAIAMLVTFLGVLAFSIEIGIAIGVATALMLHLHRTSNPHIAVVGRVGNSEHFRNVKRHTVRTCPGTHAVRVDESLYFANSRELESCLLGAASKDDSIKNVLLICTAVNAIDSSALETLERVNEELASAGVTLYFAEIKGPVMDKLERVGFFDEIGVERVFLSTHEAFEHFGCKAKI